MEKLKQFLTVVGERTWLGITGYSGIQSDTIVEKKQIKTSRSFGTEISTFDSLRESVANFSTSCAYKLRAQKSVAQGMVVFVDKPIQRKCTSILAI